MTQKSLILSFIMLGFSFLSFGQYEKEAVEEVILEAYVNGAYNDGIVRNMELGFSEHFQAFEIDKDGNTSVLNLKEWMARVAADKEAGKYPLSAEDHVSIQYQNIDIYKNVAQVKLLFKVGNKPYAREALTLYQSPKGWLILTKTFQLVSTVQK